MNKLTNKDIKLFLDDFESNSTIELLTSANETKEIEKIAEAKGIKLKGNRDLAGFKTVYAFANMANKNDARLPKSELFSPCTPGSFPGNS